MMRQLFTTPSFVAIVLKKDEQILLIKRKNTGCFDGYYALPAGAVEAEESIFYAAIRETQEEIGVRLKQDALHVSHVLHRKSEQHDQRIIFFLQASSWDGTIENREPDKHEQLEWFALDKLPENIIPHHKEALIEISKNNFFSEDGWDEL